MNSEWDIEEITKQSLLYDFYGELLTKRQKQVYELYTQENLSLAEIAEELEISRQGVHDSLRSARKALDRYEEKLDLVDRFLRAEDTLREIDQQIISMIGLLQGPESGNEREALIRRLEQIKAIIDRLEE